MIAAGFQRAISFCVKGGRFVWKRDDLFPIFAAAFNGKPFVKRCLKYQCLHDTPKDWLKKKFEKIVASLELNSLSLQPLLETEATFLK